MNPPRWLRWDGPPVAALSDGHIDLAPAVFGGVDAARRDALLAAAGLDPAAAVRTDVTAFLVIDGERRWLVDAGMGHFGGPTMGRLPQSLALAGLAPADVTDVLLTHLHRDHCGGLLDAQGRLVFGNARIHVAAPEFDHWTDAALAATAPESARRFFAVAAQVMAACEGRVQRFAPGAALGGCLRTEALAGHTPGQCAVWVAPHATGGTPLCLWADTVHCAALQLADPDVTVGFDSDADAARRTRRGLLARAAAGRFLVGGAHLPFPGFGRIEAVAGVHRFTPADASHHSQETCS